MRSQADLQHEPRHWYNFGTPVMVVSIFLLVLTASVFVYTAAYRYGKGDGKAEAAAETQQMRETISTQNTQLFRQQQALEGSQINIAMMAARLCRYEPDAMERFDQSAANWVRTCDELGREFPRLGGK